MFPINESTEFKKCAGCGEEYPKDAKWHGIKRDLCRACWDDQQEAERIKKANLNKPVVPPKEKEKQNFAPIKKDWISQYED